MRRDRRIHEDVSDLLTEDPRLDASEIEVLVDQGEVVLQGFVASKWAKRRAEDVAEMVQGILRVQNNLRVQAPGTSYARGIGGPDGS